MKYRLPLLLLTLWTSSIFAQCPEGFIQLQSQAQVDAFAVDYPNCTEIQGKLVIGNLQSQSGIGDLSALSGLTAISGALEILNTAHLTSLSGLDNLNSLGGGLVIKNNPALTSLSGLEQLSSTVQRLVIEKNAALISLSGLEGVTTVGVGFLHIRDNPSLISLTGLNNLTTVWGNLEIRNNSSLVSLDGLNSLTTVHGQGINIQENNSLTSLSGLEGLQTIWGGLRISNHESLLSLDGLDNLASLTGVLTIARNDALNSISAIEYVDASTISNLFLNTNPQLSACAVRAICNFVEERASSQTYDNAEGCNSHQEIKEVCDTIPKGDVCLHALDISELLGQEIGVPQQSVLLDNTDNTATDTPTNTPLTCYQNLDPITNSFWVRFTGDGNVYRFNTVNCNATNYIDAGNTQMALYQGEGTCQNLLQVACDEDEDTNAGLLNALIDQFHTMAETEYFLLIDGFDGAMGEFCLEVTLQEVVVNSTEISPADFKLFPNPTTGLLQLLDIEPEQVDVYSSKGQRLASFDSPPQELDLSNLPAGMYYVHLIVADRTHIAKIVKL